MDLGGTLSDLFTETYHCKSGMHCQTCRAISGGRAWRKSLRRAFDLPGDREDFACPHGKQWGHRGKGKPVLGPGDRLTLMLNAFGVEHLEKCGCEEKAARMNRWGWRGCLIRLPLICWWMLVAVARRSVS